MGLPPVLYRKNDKIMECPSRILIYLKLFSRLTLFTALAASGSGLAQQAETPEYFLSDRYLYFGDTYVDVADNRTLTRFGRERGSEGYTGKLYKARTTGGFSSSGVPEVNTTTIPGFTDDYKILRFQGNNNPVTEKGDLLMMIGKTDNIGRPTASSAVIWKADNSVVIANPIKGAKQLWPKDLNESLVGCGYIRIEYEDKFGQKRLRDEPVLISPAGTVTVIQPSRVDSYGYEFDEEGTSWDAPTKDNQFRAMAINNQGAVVCNGKAIFKTAQGNYYWEYYSFVSQNGVITAANLPAGGSDINDLGEVVGVNRQGTWLYRPGSGVSYIDSVVYNDGYDAPDANSNSYWYQNLNSQALINNLSEVTWLWINYANVGGQDFPKRLWKDGTLYNVTDLYETDETFTLHSVTDLNEEGDLLIRTEYPVEYDGQTYTAIGNRIISTRPFAKELIVNVTDDVPDANPDDQVIDVDLQKSGLQVSLRAAIDAVNDGLSTEIEFDIPGDSIPVIILIQALPEITRPVKIDGTTQKAGKVEVRGGAFAGAGFHLKGGNSEVRGMVLNGFNGVNSAAVRISDKGDNVIAGNWLGTNADGSQLRQTQFGVLIEGTAKNTIGGESAADGNIIYGETAGISMKGAGTDETKILGNRIGIGSNNTIFTPLAGSGIFQTGGSGTVIGNTGSGGNLIAAGNGISIQAEDGPMDNIKVEGNSIGLDGSGTTASNGDIGIIFAAGTTHEFKKFELLSNKIAGHYLNVLGLSGGALKEAIIKNNEVGLAFNGSGQRPTGMKEDKQLYGIRMDGPAKVNVSDNVVAGHVYNLLLSGIVNFEVFGGEDTDGDGEPDSNFSVNIFTPEEGERPDTEPVAENGIIKGNFVGLDRQYRVPEGNPEQLVGIANFGGAKGTKIEANTVGGQKNIGIYIESGLDITVEKNRVGVSSTGMARPNGTGIKIDEAIVSLQDNIVAQNKDAGIVISEADENNAVLIQGGSIYKNGNGSKEVGIVYEDAPLEPVSKFFVLKSQPHKSTGLVDITFAVPEVGGLSEEGGVELKTVLEIWGNPNDDERQGRTLLLSKEIDPNEDFSYKTSVKPSSAFATASNYTATLTRGKFTSVHSQAFKPVAFEWPELNFTPSEGEGAITLSEDEIGFRWPVVVDPELFLLETATSFAGPWTPFEGASVEGDVVEAVVPLGQGEQQLFRLRINPSSLKNLNPNLLPPTLELKLDTGIPMQ
jgi:hypothetical protein